ncbi:metallophosphoesterase family protein [Plantibacter sp. YIM 135347]|uniref:metallophosphoesterase family protein n=1 Tax=Plantibacter sp. YIM 135347 TaxID=3423919 RepID=UPI003D3504E9
MSRKLRYLVVSDLHAFGEALGANSPSSLSALDSSTFPDQLFTRCAETVLESFDGIEAILVAGDMVDKADATALPFVWQKLQLLGSLLSAPVIATAGNHDMDSQGIYSPTPNEALINLEPPFPSGSIADRASYFAEQHAVITTENSVIVTVNTSAHHGLMHAGTPESNHGRFTSSLPHWVRRNLLQHPGLPETKLVLAHHHPLQLPDIDTKETSATVGSEDMMRMLAEFGDWIIVHGHKHRGWVHYGFGGGDAPVVFSSSSFSANLGEEEFGRLVQRQFHVLEVHDPKGPTGLVYSWNHDGSIWRPAGSQHMLSGVSGFGWRTSLDQVTETVREALRSTSVLDRSEIDALLPHAKYLTFDDRRRLLIRLESGVPEIGHTLSESGEIDELHIRARI